MCTNKCGNKEEVGLDVEGALFGYKIIGDLIELYVEDDECWHYKMSFHRLWIKDLLRTTYNLDKRI